MVDDLIYTIEKFLRTYVSISQIRYRLKNGYWGSVFWLPKRPFRDFFRYYMIRFNYFIYWLNNGR